MILGLVLNKNSSSLKNKEVITKDLMDGLKMVSLNPKDNTTAE